MKYWIFLFLLFSNTVLASSIAVSPNTLTFSHVGEELSLFIFNPNGHVTHYVVESPNTIVVGEPNGTMSANSKKKVHLKLVSEIEEELILIKFISSHSSNSVGILPAVAVKVLYVPQETKKSLNFTSFFLNKTVLLIVGLVILVGLGLYFYKEDYGW